MAIKSQAELDSALQAVAAFHGRVPQFSGSELDVSLMLERIAKTGREMTADALERTYYELHGEGLLNLLDNPVDDMLAPVEDVRDYTPPPAEQVEAPPTEDDEKYQDFEIELADNVDPND